MKAFLEILRPFNCVMASAAAIIGQLIAGGFSIQTSALIFLAVFIVTGAGNAINDYYDREIDSVNRPERPIPSGRLRPGAALNYSILLFIAGCVAAGLVNHLCLALAAVNSILLIFYARNLKAMPLAGNICVSFLTGSTFLFGGAAFGLEGIRLDMVPFLLSFLATMSRELAKDIEDMEGDRHGGALTLPLLAGESACAALASAFVLAAVILSFFAPFGTAYLVVVAVADILFLASVPKILRGDAPGAQRRLKLGMAVALLAFATAALI